MKLSPHQLANALKWYNGSLAFLWQKTEMDESDVIFTQYLWKKIESTKKQLTASKGHILKPSLLFPKK